MSVLILCARISWPVIAIRQAPLTLADVKYPTWRCSHCGARVKVVA